MTLAAKSGGATASLASRSAVNDGQWHHVIAEADRKAGTFTIYIDGKQDAGGPGLGADASLANDADLYVGGTPQRSLPERCDRLPAHRARHAGRLEDHDRGTLRVGVQRAVPRRLHRPPASGRRRMRGRHR